jgi:adenylate kinase
MVVIVSGTPGTGKTTFAKEYAKKHNLEYIDVNKIIDEYNLSLEYDNELQTKIIDTNKLNEVLIKIIKNNKNIVIDSHLSHYLPKKYVDKCFITKCELKVLKKRLTNRGYSEKKIRDNLDAEIFDTCRIEAQELGHIIDVITT